MKKIVHVLLCMVWLVLCAALPAFGAESAPHVTAETTMAQLRANPAIQGTGYYTYCREMTPLMVARWKNKTLHDYFGDTDRESGIAALNLIIDNYNKGVKVTYQVYTPEEIEQNSSLGCVQLFYYPAETPNAKTAIVIPGNALTMTSEMGEGGSTAYELHKRGYAVFVLRYRTFLDLGNNAPLQDLARAVQLVTSLDEELSIQTQDYALVGYSSGGQLVGVFANKERGYGHYGVARPGALLLGYSVVNFSEVKIAYQAFMDTGNYGWHYYCSSIADLVTDDYPPVFFWYGKDDKVLPWMINQVQGPALQAALEAHKVPYVVKVFESAPHCIGVGDNTDAEGWLTEAVAFWEQQTAA